jgi:hypothetical protein
MPRYRASSILLTACLATAPAIASGAPPRLRAEPYASGLSRPVAVVQDPTDDARQMVVEQGGLIRVIVAGQVLATPFLNLSGAIVSGGEQGLLGMAFAPDYASSGRFYVNFTNPAGDTVIARFLRSTSNPLTADPASRFDLRWGGPGGLRYIDQPFANHNGGDLHFGPDGFLYIGMGDGGSGGDPEGYAQNPNSLLGKMLRIDVNVLLTHPEGYVVPPSNPFVGGGGPVSARPEIWAFGLRNPWRFSFDRQTGALIMGDVGQGQREEINYQPAGMGALNYGWRNYEGTLAFNASAAPAYLPLTFPALEYGRDAGRSVTGGVMCRQCIGGGEFDGRYFFADFITGRVWSVRFAPDSSGQTIAVDRLEHTAELSGGAGSVGNVSAMATAGPFRQLFMVLYDRGTIVRVSLEAPARRLAYGVHFTGAAADRAIYRPESGEWFCTCGDLPRWGRPGDIPVPGLYGPTRSGRALETVAVFRPSSGQWFVPDSPVVSWGLPGDIPVPARYGGANAFKDIAVFRPSTGTWFVKERFTVSWGLPGDIPVPTDYDGDGVDDIAVYRPSTGRWYLRNIATLDWGLRGDIPVPADYDGDGTADVAVFRPRTGEWLVRGKLTRVWGRAGDIPVPLDVNGDGRAELVVFRPAAGTWYAIDPATGATDTLAFGRAGDVPLGRVAPALRSTPGDFDGDRRADVGIYRPSGTEWWTLASSTGNMSHGLLIFGTTGDRPVVGDYDGDGIRDVAAYREAHPSSWDVLWSSRDVSPLVTSMWGVTGDEPTPADYDGDGRTDVAVWRPSQGRWYVLSSSTAQGLMVDWGLDGDIPVPADFDGDGRADFAVFRPSIGRWFIRGLYTGITTVSDWGLDGDIPVAADFDGDRRADIAIFRPSTGQWWIRQSATGTIVTLDWGLNGDVPVTLDFDGDGRTEITVFRPSTGRWHIRGAAAIDWGRSGDVPLIAR